MNVEEWFETHTFKCRSFCGIKKLLKLKKERKKTISLCIPTLNEEENIGNVIDVIKSRLMEKYALLDEIIVVDSGSTDKTKEIVEQHDIPFYYASDYLKKYGQTKGRGENIWKSLYLAKGDILVFLDADIKNIHPRFVYGLVGPLLTNKKIWYVNSFFKRPFVKGEKISPFGGGRVTELLVRPLINMFFPRLSGFIQPLGGAYAGRRKVFENMPIFTGYGCDIAIPIDIQRRFGLRRMAQVDLKRIFHRHQKLPSLANEAFAILEVLARKANTLGKLVLVKNIKKSYRIIQRSKENGKIKYNLINKNIIEKQRPPIITLPEYRKKFRKIPKWLRM